MRLATTSRALKASALITVLALAQACTKWAAPTQPLPAEFARDTGQTIRVRERNGKQYYIHSPKLRNDTLFGVQGETVHLAIPMTNVASIQVERRDKAKTFGLALAIIAIGALVFIGIKAIIDDDYDRT